MVKFVNVLLCLYAVLNGALIGVFRLFFLVYLSLTKEDLSQSKELYL